jgi:DNA-binding NtrC family response regulator
MGGCMTSKQILIVDDDPNVREILVQRLRQRHFIVESAENGDVALGRLAEHDFDFVLLDLMMPTTGGPAVLRAMQALPRKPRVIVLSAMASVWQAHSEDADGIQSLEKPVDFARLLKLLGE